MPQNKLTNEQRNKNTEGKKQIRYPATFHEFRFALYYQDETANLIKKLDKCD